MILQGEPSELLELSLQRLNFLDCSSKRNILVRVGEKQYCQAKKEANRFRVPVGTKFYRVKVTAFNRDAST